MKKLILVVGMDNTGKTTLANRLSKELNIEKVNFPYELVKNLTKEEWTTLFLSKTFGKNINLFERFTPIEELVYGPVLRQYSKFTEDEMISILSHYEVFLIYCRPLEGVIEDWKDREQLKGVKEKSYYLIERFDYTINLINYRLPKAYVNFKYYTYDYTDEKSFSFLLKQLNGFLKGELI